MAEMWEISEALAETNRFKAFNKKHPRELAACFSNLAHIVALLNRHGNVGAFQVAIRFGDSYSKLPGATPIRFDSVDVPPKGAAHHKSANKRLSAANA